MDLNPPKYLQSNLPINMMHSPQIPCPDKNFAPPSKAQAMTLVFDQPNLPFPGGVLTPAVACGEALARRLIHSGVKFKMGEWFLGPYGWGPVWCM